MTINAEPAAVWPQPDAFLKEKAKEKYLVPDAEVEMRSQVLTLTSSDISKGNKGVGM